MDEVSHPQSPSKIFYSFIYVAKQFNRYTYSGTSTDPQDDHCWIVNWAVIEMIQKKLDNDPEVERYGFIVWHNILKNGLPTWNLLENYWNEHLNEQQIQLNRFYQETDIKLLTFEESIDIPPLAVSIP